jgi:signal transduction histidine kinase
MSAPIDSRRASALPRPGWRRRRPRSVAATLTLALILVTFIFFQSATLFATLPAKPVRRVLIFNDFGSISSPGIALLDQAIVNGLENSPYQIELYSESLEATLFSDEASQQKFREWHIRKYSDRKPDVIITVGPRSLKFMVESHETAFPNIPVIFCGGTEEMLDELKLDSHYTGVWGVAQPERTLLAALRLKPDTKHIVVVGGIGSFDRSIEAVARKSFQKYESQYEFTYLTDLDMRALLDRLRQLPDKTVIYHTSMMEDAAGAHFIDAAQSVPMIVSAANAPIFVLDDVDVGRGTVGGDVVSWASDGRVAAGLAVSILDGAKPRDLPIVKNENIYLFDWRALRRWGLRESNLPPGSVVIFRELSIWERTKRIWISGLVVIFILSVLAVYLQFSRRQLKQARDAQLELSGLLINAQEMERTHIASELHDDFSQRLALLAVGLENATESLTVSTQTTKQKLNELYNSASEIGADLHTVSHRLHPLGLKSLGLASGVKALCKEFSSRQSIEVNFSTEDVPREVPPDVALCIFRVVQEGLQNLKKHSGAAHAQVNLRMDGDKLLLSVRDDGVGFDAGEMANRVSLGLRSMRERVRLVNGQLEIHSEPAKGTRIEACVPLGLKNLPAS